MTHVSRRARKPALGDQEQPPLLSPGREPAPERTSLSLRGDLDLDEWVRIALRMNRMGRPSLWWLGDWLNYGKERFPNGYKHALEAVCLDYQTLRNYAWVAGSVRPAQRNPRLSFQHHAEVAALPAAEQEKWLARAERYGWSRNRLRAAVKRHGAAGAAPARVRLPVDDDRLSQWRAAATHQGRELDEWIISILDAAARPPAGTAEAVGCGRASRPRSARPRDAGRRPARSA
ncbi:hypothetical protein Acsp04_31150 [Actinomadura sp. NBRC 104425]|nr:hypothetical protein Acsp04_31150 [Actinomadura sp. NBRC 104425]